MDYHKDANTCYIFNFIYFTTFALRSSKGVVNSYKLACAFITCVLVAFTTTTATIVFQNPRPNVLASLKVNLFVFLLPMGCLRCTSEFITSSFKHVLEFASMMIGSSIWHYYGVFTSGAQWDCHFGALHNIHQHWSNWKCLLVVEEVSHNTFSFLIWSSLFAPLKSRS